ncbi:TadE/TadG family type IV pilus assembly protein [Bythopirellula goksoeyrii]|uniref:TadE-like protein n=1 Tax=Bythopirellula goksoeyrii TaxID=1400387 RepID=A0A5B9QM04_9BACT|nr:TadE/TadG family type IV pilus assembly protein [Bythopirellula goksoeyrii]QEG38036.1 TadE-like protein [Bythopirellula goksoeyrii]
MKNLKTPWKKSRRHTPDRRGATVVEFAIVASVFFVVVSASVEFVRLNVIRHTADNAAYEAARDAMVPGATAAEAIAKANSILNVVGTRGATVTITPPVLNPDIPEVNVRIDIPLNPNGWITPKFTSGKSLTVQSTLRKERVPQ